MKRAGRKKRRATEAWWITYTIGEPSEPQLGGACRQRRALNWCAWPGEWTEMPLTLLSWFFACLTQPLVRTRMVALAIGVANGLDRARVQYYDCASVKKKTKQRKPKPVHLELETEEKKTTESQSMDLCNTMIP